MTNWISVDHAQYFAIGAHGSQKRKYTGDPYWYHLRNVSDTLRTTDGIINRFGFNILTVAWLHDVVEDTDTSIFTVQELFGDDIAKYVSDLTEPSKEFGNREQRKEYYNDILSKADPLVQTVKLADMIDNTSSIEEHDPEFARVYFHEKRRLLEIMTKGDTTLYEIACKQVRM